MTYGMKISKPGYNVNTCAEEDLVFSSELDYHKIDQVGSVNITIANGQTMSPWTEIAHGYAYKPMVLVWGVLDTTGDYDFEFFTQEYVAGSPTYLCGHLDVTSTYLRLALHRSGTTGDITRTVYYYIFANEV